MLRQRMVGRRGQHEGLAQQAFTDQSRLLQRLAHHRQVDPARAQCLQLLEGGGLQQVDGHAWPFPAHLGDGARQEVVYRAGNKADGQRAALAQCSQPGTLCGAVGLIEQRLGLDEEGTTGGGERHRTRAASEQRDAELVFQQLDLPAQRRLRHVQALGGATEIQFAGQGGKAAQLGEFEH